MSSSTVWGYKSTLHPNEALHYVGNRKKHLCSCNDLRCESLLWKAVTLTEEKTVSTPMLEPRAASNSTAMLTHVLLDQPPVQIQLDCRASCYVTPQCCKAATWHWKSGHTLVMHNKAIQKAAGKCGLSSEVFDTCMCHLCQSKLRTDLRTALWHPQPGRGRRAHAIMIPLPRCKKKSECPDGKTNWEIEHQYNWQNSWRYISTRLHHTAVKAGNWAWVLTTHLDLVWKSWEKLRITKALKINWLFIASTWGRGWTMGFSGQKCWLHGILRACWAVQEWNISLSTKMQKTRRILHVTTALYSKVSIFKVDNFSGCHLDPKKLGAK